MRYITTILSLALLAMLPGCIVIENAATTAVTAADTSDPSSEPPGTSSFGPVDPTTGSESPDLTTGLPGSTGGDPDQGTGGGSSDSSDSSGSTGAVASSTGDAPGSTSGGEILDSCEFGEPCQDGVCAPNGECVAACQADGRCAADELCLGGGCVDVGSDMQEAQVVAINDSPVGAVSKYDVDVWKIKLFQPGSYSVIVSGTPVSAYVITGAGDIVATPANAEQLGEDIVSYPAQIDDVSLPVVLLLMSSSLDFQPYYFYTIKN